MAEDSQINVATLATVTTTLVFIQQQLAELKADIKALSLQFASKEELLNVNRENLERLGRIERSSNLWKWISPTMSAVLASIVTFFIIEYFQHYH